MFAPFGTDTLMVLFVTETGEEVWSSVGPCRAVERVKELITKAGGVRSVAIFFYVVRDQQAGESAAGVVNELAVKIAAHRRRPGRDESHRAIGIT